MAKSTPARSEGARLERAVMRSRLRRRIRATTEKADVTGRLAEASDLLAWVLARSKRYDKKPGGLGR